VVAVVDTNVDPELVQYPIPGNDDAIRANSLLSRVIADAVEEGRFIAGKRDPGSAPVVRSAEQEAEFTSQQAAARREAAAAQAARERRLQDSAIAADTGDDVDSALADTPVTEAAPVVEDATRATAVAEAEIAETTDDGVIAAEAESVTTENVEAADSAPVAPEAATDHTPSDDAPETDTEG